MKPVEFISANDMMNVYMIVKEHPYWNDLAEMYGGKFISRNSDWESVYRIPMSAFVGFYQELAECVPFKLDKFLEQTIGEILKTPKHEFNVPMIETKGLLLPHITPKYYQDEAFSHAMFHKKSIVALPVGGGKSAVGKMVKEYTGIPFAVIPPACVKYQWRSEIKMMTGRDAFVIDGTPQKRQKQWKAASEFEWMIFNYETLVSDAAMAEKRKGVIIDEAHYLKNPDSKRTKAVMEYIKGAEYVLLLTGTFLVNTLLDGWSLLKMTDDIKGDGSFFLFKKNNCILDTYNNPIAYKTSIIPFKKKLRNKVYYRQKEEIMSHLPPRTDVFVDLQMTPLQDKIYKKAEEGILIDLDDPDKERELNGAAAYTRLRQLSTDPILVFPDTDKKKKLSAKIEWIQNFVDEFEDRTMIIYCPFDTFLERIMEEIPDAPWVHIHGATPAKKREELIEKYRNSHEKAYFLITDAMKTGKNIQFCQHFIFCSWPLTWADYDQLRGRIWREGQEKPVFVYHLQALESIDHDNCDLVYSKKDLMNDFNIKKISKDYLRQALKNKRMV